jgi:DNA-binding NarL/FixJ family response regulator
MYDGDTLDVRASRLSLREEQIVSSLIVGATAREIARELELSFHTVRTHIRKIYAKIGICCRVELVNWHHAR